MSRRAVAGGPPTVRGVVAGLALIATLALGACPICPDGTLKLVSGDVPVPPGEAISLELHYDGLVAGPTRCKGFWYVEGVLGGDATVGTVDTCGTYTAPATPPAASVFIEAGEFERFGCADCCPWAARHVDLVQP